MSVKEYLNETFRNSTVHGPVTIFALYENWSVTTNASFVVTDGVEMANQNGTKEYLIHDNITLSGPEFVVGISYPVVAKSSGCKKLKYKKQAGVKVYSGKPIQN